MPKHILVPYEPSDVSRTALTRAFEIAKENQAKITLLFVLHIHPPTIGPPTGLASVSIFAMAHILGLGVSKDIKKFQSMAKKFNIELDGVLLEIPRMLPLNQEIAKTIVDYTLSNGIDMIVMGHRSKSELYQNLFGSVSNEVKNLDPPCSVLVVN